MAINFKVLPDCPPNVVFRYDDNGQPVHANAFDDLKLTAPLTEVILPLARRHPDWRFETHNFTARRFTVSKDNEILGDILTDYRNYTTVVKIKNSKIASKITRGDGMLSGDTTKIRKLVERYFVPRTEEERVNSKRNELVSQLNSLGYTARQQVRTKEGPIVSSLLPALLREHRDTVFSVATSLSITGLEELEAAYTAARLMSDFNTYANTVGVVRDGDKYWVTQGPLTGLSSMLSFTDETLPLQLRTNIGLLKLAEVGDAYDGVGVRCGSDLFLTMYKKEE